MFRKMLIILSLIGLLLRVAAWAASCFGSVGMTGGRNMFNVQARDVSYVRLQWSMVPSFAWHSKDFEVRMLNWVPAYYDGGDFWAVYVPFWTLVVLFSASIYYFCFPCKRRHRRKLGLCVNCAYDLRGSVGRCPECGKEFS